MSTEMFFLDDLIEKTRGLARASRLKHPFLMSPIQGSDALQAMLRATFAALDQPVTPWLEFSGDGMATMVWKSRARGHDIHGVTIAVLNADHQVEEVRILLREFEALSEWRARLRDRMPAAPGWDLPPDLAQTYARAGVAAPGAPDGTPLPFPPTDDARFYSPAFVKAVEGADRMSHVVSHARGVYGACEAGPVLRNGAHALRTLTSKLPLEIASVSQLTSDGRVSEMSAFMQPWPVVAVFCQGMRARLGSYLDPSFFELDHDGSSRP